MKRRRMSRGASKRSFRRGARPHGRNARSGSARGGYRL